MKGIYAQINKVDEEKRLVYGIAAAEVPDRSGEILDYETSKAHFQSWVKETLEASDGQSHGNLRAMHGKVAAGKLTGIEFDDANKQFPVVAKVVDDQEWKKVLEGVYTGFSIGGSYIKKWDDPEAKKADGSKLVRYTAAPNELSLVDRPCIPAAKFFDVQKADGSVEQVLFKNQGAEEEDELDPDDSGEGPSAEKSDGPVEYLVDGSEQDIAALAKLMHDQQMNVSQVIEVLNKAFEPKEEKKEASEEAKEEKEESEGNEPRNAEAEEGGPHEEPDGDEGEQQPTKADATEDLQKAEDLRKAEDERLEKLVSAAVTKATEPLQKTITEQAERIKKLEALPLQPKGVLKAVSKAADAIDGDAKESEVDPVTKDGQVNDAATDIKKLHQAGGKPLAWGLGGPKIN